MEVSMEQSLVVRDNKKGLRSLNKRQWTSLICLALGNMGLATCSSLQAPFFPKEAEKKGATPAEYGLVFGVFYLTVFVFSPIFGKMMHLVSPEFMRDAGMFVVAVCFILFGMLEKSPPGVTFLTLAYVIRIVEGIGSASFKTSNFTLVAGYFPDTMATTLGVLETTFGFGLILGPSCGAVLFQWGGYALPFVLSGIFLLLVTAVSFFLLPKIEPLESRDGGASFGVWKFVKNPLVILYLSMLTLAPTCLGFNMATLEPHLRQFNLSPVGVGMMFVVSGGIYGFTSSVFGYLCDKGASPKLLALISCLCFGVCYTLIGPAPIFTFPSTLWVVVVSLVLFGIGFGGTRVIAYVDCLNESVSLGFPNDQTTSGVISGTFSAALAIGFFLGPTIGGVFLETIGYNWGSAILAILMYCQSLSFVVYMLWNRNKGSYDVDHACFENASVVEDHPLVISTGATIKYTTYGSK